MINKYRHIKTAQNQDGIALAWVVQFHEKYVNLTNVAQENGYQITQSQERTISDYEIQISEDVESVKSLIELYLKIAIHNLDKNPYLNQLRSKVIPEIQFDLDHSEFISSANLHRVQTFYTDFFRVLMDSSNYHAYHQKYHEYESVLKQSRVFKIQSSYADIVPITSRVDEIKKQLIYINEFYNLLQIACLPIIFYVETVVKYFESLLKDSLGLIDLSYLSQDISEVYHNHFPLRFATPNVSIHRFTSQYNPDQQINLLNFIAIDQINS